nr:type IVB secretion system protein DotA [Tatlockia sp.]
KASGYCLMQIFVMWVVVQGVGAADKVWSAALGYLNRGGVIVQTQMSPQVSLASGDSTVASGAAKMLQGQVCMLGLQKVLQNTMQSYQDALNKTPPSGPCTGSPSKAMRDFCTAGQVPDFIGTVNMVAEQAKTPNSTGGFSVSMPTFTSEPFSALNGICGTISWDAFAYGDIMKIRISFSDISPSEIQSIKMSRAIALQRMYENLTTVANIMVANNPALNPQLVNSGNQSNFSPVATQQYGVPYLNSGTICNSSTPACTSWGKDSSGDSAPLFNGSEFQSNVAVYNAYMLPTLNLVQQAGAEQEGRNQHSFIKKADQNGWLLAGSYFFDLSMLNASSIKTANLTDTDTGLNRSDFDPSTMSSAFSSDGTNITCTGTYKNLCEWLDKKTTAVNPIVSLINGSGLLNPPLPPPNVRPAGGKSMISISKVVTGVGSSTVNGFIDNGSIITLPGQPGMNPPSFAMKMNISVNLGQYNLKWQEFPCGDWLCLGRILGDIFYNVILRNLFNMFLGFLAPIMNAIIQTMLIFPLVAIAQIFQENVAIIQQPTANPVVALANMGVNYINFANELWITIIGLSATPFVFVIFPLIALILPLLMSWLFIMVSIGFICAYYIPFLPYMIFTFATIAWLIAVIEAMVAAPIVALGVTHPEGHDAFGKGEQAIMILMNVFLRPSLMIIGYIAAIALAYVSIWIINAGFANAAAFIQGTASGVQWNYSFSNSWNNSATQNAAAIANDYGSMNTGYSGWAGVYGFFFSVLIYTVMYLTVVQKAFTLITYLPDKVLRWIGGQPEGLGEQAAQWAEGETKKQVEGGAKETSKASGQRDQQLGGYATSMLGKGKTATSGEGTSVNAEATPEPSPDKPPEPPAPV